MEKEIERRFLVVNQDWRKLIIGQAELIKQFYLVVEDNCSIRVRRSSLSYKDAEVTFKISSPEGIHERYEFNHLVPIKQYDIFMHQMDGFLIQKTRYKIQYRDDIFWEIDVFEKENKGLVIAEIEIPSIDFELDIPNWLGEEITENPEYLNSSLSQVPFDKLSSLLKLSPLKTKESRPENCRNRLQDEGKAHPRSGCKVEGCGGFFGKRICE